MAKGKDPKAAPGGRKKTGKKKEVGGEIDQFLKGGRQLAPSDLRKQMSVVKAGDLRNLIKKIIKEIGNVKQADLVARLANLELTSGAAKQKVKNLQEDLEAAKAQYGEQIDELRAQLTLWQKKEAEVGAALAKTRAQYDALVKENEHLSAQLKDRDKQLADRAQLSVEAEHKLRAELEASAFQIAQLAERVAGLEADKVALTDRERELNKELARLRDEVAFSAKAHYDELKRLRQELEGAKTLAGGRAEELSGMRDELAAMAGSKAQAVSDLESDVGRLRDRLARLEEERVSERDRLEAELAKAQERIEHLSAELDKVRQRLAAAEASKVEAVERLEDKLEASEQREGQLRTELTELQKTYGSSEHERIARIEALEANVAELLARNGQLESELAGAQEKVAAGQQRIEQLHGELDALRARAAGLATELQQERNELGVVSEQLELSQAKLVEETERYEGLLDGARERESGLEAQVAKLKERLAELHGEAKKKIGDLKKQVDQLKREGVEREAAHRDQVARLEAAWQLERKRYEARIERLLDMVRELRLQLRFAALAEQRPEVELAEFLRTALPEVAAMPGAAVLVSMVEDLVDSCEARQLNEARVAEAMALKESSFHVVASALVDDEMAAREHAWADRLRVALQRETDG